jgi:sorbitol/mannitol transport system permease protein
MAVTAPLRAPDEPPAVLAQPTRSRAERWSRRLPLLPALVFTIVMTQLPFLVTIYISVVRWNALEPGEHTFVGLENYTGVLTDSGFRNALLTTVVMTTSAVLLSLLLGLGFALLLNGPFLGRGLARTLIITPFLIMPVASALLWKYLLYSPTFGLFNGVLTAIWRLFGSDSPPQPEYVASMPMGAVVAALVWQWVPFQTLILLAGLQSMSTEVLEAAAVDGAGRWQTFRYLTLPHLRQYLELGLLLGAIYIVQSFDAIYTITGGGPGTATTNLPYQLYIMVFRRYDYGAAAAAGVITVLLTIIVATFALRVISNLLKEDLNR